MTRKYRFSIKQKRLFGAYFLQAHVTPDIFADGDLIPKILMETTQEMLGCAQKDTFAKEVEYLF